MNREILRKINIALAQVRQSNKSGSHVNCIRLNHSCSDQHNDEIVKRCREALKLGIPFVTEAIFINGQRCDILWPVSHSIDEIMVSETEEDFKKKKYPDIFRINKVRL